MPFYTENFLHTDAWFTHRRFHKENLLRTNFLTHTVEIFVRIFLHKETYTQRRIGAQTNYTEQPLHASKLQFQRDFSSLTIISCEKVVKVSHISGKNDGEKQRFSHSCDSPTGNGKRATAKGNGTTTVQRERDKGTTAQRREGQPIHWATRDNRFAPIDPKTKGRNSTRNTRHQPGNKTTALRDDPKETYKRRTPTKSRSHGRR